MHLKEIREMVNLMNEHDLMELELECNGLKIKLKKNLGQIQQTITQSSPALENQPQPTAAQQKAHPAQGLLEIKAPMVGTFYRTPSPESPAYVDIGSEIQPGDVICIIEAMKLMNEIKVETKGRIKEILVENGHPVEFGQVLFRFEPV